MSGVTWVVWSGWCGVGDVRGVVCVVWCGGRASVGCQLVLWCGWCGVDGLEWVSYAVGNGPAPRRTVLQSLRPGKRHLSDKETHQAAGARGRSAANRQRRACRESQLSGWGGVE